ncbi:MAG: twin-arginine translocase subunit TatC [Archaeoglobaceae archaeon]|nr:twin-arginine translocase subunit TatC [Archaeoglobaceae archaeon]MDW8128677.1 twin-arginine translocase subunit TatC [Archaeoglobaceae archaeon]
MEEREQKITEHIAELRRRVTRISISLLVLFPIVFYFSSELIKRFWQDLLSEEMFVYSPLEWILLRLVFSLIFSLILLYPYAIFELYLFAKPGLYESEIKFLKFIMIPSYFIFLLGSYVSYKFIVPFLYSFSYGNPFYSAEKTVLNAMKLSFALGILLQIPLAIFILDKLRIINYQTLKRLRLPLYLILVFFILNSPTDFGGLTQIAVLVSFFIIFELSILIIGLSKR